MATLKRSDILPHPKNPRQIDAKAQKTLFNKMGEIGLLQPLIVNKRTGYLLGGHQRLAVMDKHEKYKDGKNDYELDVALVDLPEKDELAMLVFLNNPSAQGTWQTDLLAEINLELGVSFDDMGFDRLDVDLLFDGDSRFSELFEDDPEVKETKASLDEIKAHIQQAREGNITAQIFYLKTQGGWKEGNQLEIEVKKEQKLPSLSELFGDATETKSDTTTAN